MTEENCEVPGFGMWKDLTKTDEELLNSLWGYGKFQYINNAEATFMEVERCITC